MTRLTLAIIFLLATTSADAAAETYRGRAAWEIGAKSTCGTLEQGITRYGIFEGRAFSRVPGEKDRHIFNVLGVNTRQCAQLNDPERGRAYRSVSREVMLYLHPESNEVMDQWKNPWTGETVAVVHVANDPVNMRAPRYEDEVKTTTARRYGDLLAFSNEVPLFYDNPLGGDFQQYVGGIYHAMEIFNNFYKADEMLESGQRLERSWIAWTRVAQWLPWMQMGSKPGMMIINATGSSEFDRQAIPENLSSVLEARYPTYFEPPPLDDSRPNETSWTVFRKRIEAQGDE